MNGEAVATAPAGAGALLMFPEPSAARVTIAADATLESVASADVMVTGAAAFSPANPEIGLRMRSGTGRYRWVMIITSP